MHIRQLTILTNSNTSIFTHKTDIGNFFNFTPTFKKSKGMFNQVIMQYNVHIHEKTYDLKHESKINLTINHFKIYNQDINNYHVQF